jgi:O-antigen ligase
MSLIAVAVFPARGVDKLHDGVWQGVFYSKNHLGRMMLFFLTSAVQLRPKWPGIGVKLTAILIYVSCLLLLLLMSGSKTALILALLFLAYYAAVRAMRQVRGTDRLALILPGGAILLFCCLIAYANLPTILSVFGGDVTLTGRTTIWSALLVSAQKRPLLGYGYAGFWIPGSSEGFDAFVRVYEPTHFAMSYSHSGYLDVLLQLGLAGLVVIMYALVRFAYQGCGRLINDLTPEVEWAIGIVLITVVYNIDEVTFAQPNLLWMMFVLACVSIQRNDIRSARAAFYADPKTVAMEMSS